MYRLYKLTQSLNLNLDFVTHPEGPVRENYIHNAVCEFDFGLFFDRS